MSSRGNGSAPDPGHLRRQLQAMDDYDFEHFVADLWDQQGWETTVEKQSNDAGVDIRATKEYPYSQKILIQAKRYGENTTVGGPDIQQYASLKQQERDADKAIIVTTGRFTSAAEDRADELNVKLINGSDLVELIERYDAQDIVSKYVETAATTGDEGSQRSIDHTSESIDVRRYVDGDIGEIRRQDRYDAIRTQEKERARIKLNPSDASLLGIFDDLPSGVQKARFRESREARALLSEDVHLTSDDDVIVEDVSDYITQSAIETDARSNIAGVIEHGVKDGQNFSDDYRQLVKIKRLAERGKKQGKNLITRGVSDFMNWCRTPPGKEESGEDDTGGRGAEIRQQYMAPADSIWVKLVAASVGMWVLTYPLIGANLQPTLGGILLLIAWPLLPVSIFLDAYRHGIASVAPKESLLYVVFTLVPFFGFIAGVIYPARRYRRAWAPEETRT